MVFAPTRSDSFDAHEQAVAPRRPEHVAVRESSGHDGRLSWRAVVHVIDRDTVQTAWHVVACSAALDGAAHCAEGQRLLQTDGDPDGHCLIDGECARCLSQH
jgi:hypothetical protein